MKQVKFIIIIIALVYIHNCLAQTIVDIDGLYYNLSGTTAAVTYVNKTGSSIYTNESYIIPSTITYEGLDYTVDKIGDYAFAPMYGNDINYGRASSIASVIILPNTIKTIGKYAFYNCEKLTHMIIPSSVQSMGSDCFTGCNTLRNIIYLRPTAPTNWVATSLTYVPDKQSYSSPSQSINNACVFEMISFGQSEFDYTGQAPTTTWSNNVNGYSASLSMPALKSEAGNHEEWIPVIFTKGEESFTANVVYRYTIKPVELTVKASNANREYGEENPQFSISYSGFINGENENVIISAPTVSTTASKTSNVGEYLITISGGSAKNYELIYEPGVLTVTKAPLSAKVNVATKVYGSQNPTFTLDYYGLKNNESTPAWTTSPTFQTDATQASGVGAYTVKAVNGVPVNYDLGEITAGTLNITPAPLTIKANDAVRQYYSDNPTFSYTCNGFVNSDNESVLITAPKLSTTATRTSNVGTYEIKVGETSSPNYSISFVNATLTITPRTLIASVGNYERIYNEENPVFEVKCDGFVGNDDENVLTSKPEAKTTAIKTSDVGTYPINVIGGSADNYTFNYTSGTFTINKAEQTISWEQDLTGLTVGDQVELKAKVSSGLPITYSLDNSSAAEVYTSGSKSYLDCKAGGHFLMRAEQSGNKNYYSSPKASNTVSIVGTNPPSDPTLTIKQADNGSVKVQVSKGSVYTFIMAPSDGWKVHSVTFNDMDVTSQLSSDGSYTTPTIDSNSTLSVIYEQGSSVVNATRTSKVKVQANSNGIRVVNAVMGDVVRVYTLDGQQQHSVMVDGQIVDIPLSKHDVYIVKVGEKTVKLEF